jgi:hypothetical protein
MNKWLRSLLGQPEEELVKRRVEKLLVGLPPCTNAVVVASPRYGLGFESFRCDVLAHSDDLLKLAELEYESWADIDGKAIYGAFIVWLRDSKSSDTVTYLPSVFSEEMHRLFENLDKRVTKIRCPDCRTIVDHPATAVKVNERRGGGTGGSWFAHTAEWRCGLGHVLYSEEHHTMMHFRRS